ncbi:MAG TPA: trypsin-like peptidase domain-containing protein [Thermoanaerobaculia bacterium]
MKPIIAGVLALGIVVSALASPLPSRRNEVVEVVEKVAPSVVNIAAEQIVRRRPSMFDEFFFGDQRQRRERSQSLGSGVIIDPKGIILTNDHVISGASKIIATTKSGVELECEVVGSDADNDLAVLRTRKAVTSLPAIRLGTSSDLMIGETVVAIGNPFGLSNTVTAGVLSALGRSVRGNENQRLYTDFLQIDAPINPGNSGGPVVNIQGDLIGIATAIIGGAQGIGFAIPVDRARRIKDDLLAFGEVRAVWVGLRGRTLTSGNGDGAKPRGFRVRSVTPDSPAARVGIRTGDLVVSVDGQPIDSEDSWQTALSTKGPGKPMRVVVRTGTAPDRTVTLQGEKPPPGLGLRTLREQLGMTVRQTRGGLQITIADRDGPAARAGLETGDLLLALNNSRVNDTEDVDKVMQRDYNRSTLQLAVGRGRYEYTLTFPLD